MRHHPSRAAGFTLIEVTIMLAVIAILATAITPMLMQQIVDAKMETTRSEAKALAEAVFGRPDVPGSFGFYGDMGRAPAGLQELVKPNPGTPYFSTLGFRGVGMGWKGPYINTGASPRDAFVDGFGRDYRFTNVGQIRSAGSNGIFDDEDDVVYPPNPPMPFGRVLVTVKRLEAGTAAYTLDPVGYSVRIYFSRDGVEAYLDDAVAPFVFDRVPQGVHAIAALRGGTTVVAQDTIMVYPGGTPKLVEFVFRP